MNAPGDIPYLTDRNVAGRLRRFKKPASRVDGDLPKQIVTQAASSLSVPLALIYNQSFSNRSWPAVWKTETVVPMPKVPTPSDLNDVRPISMTTLWSKVMESYVAAQTISVTGNNWKKTQHGGRKGSSTDHVLIELWDKILSDLDTSPDRAQAVVVCGVDFSKSFSRCSHQQILLAYEKLGADQWLLDMHAAFLTDRQMSVKVGNKKSCLHAVTGGAVQGSILGVLDHNAVMEFIDDDFENMSLKYVDDMTTVESLPRQDLPIATEDGTK